MVAEEAVPASEEAVPATEEAVPAAEEAVSAAEEAVPSAEKAVPAAEAATVAEANDAEAGANSEALTSHCWICWRDVLAEDWGGERCSDVDACEQRREESELSQRKRKRRASSYA